MKRQIVNFLNQYLEMGTWTVVGDFRRVYRVANLEYKGWQKSSITTPDELFDTACNGVAEPFWSKFIQDRQRSLIPDCTPVESRDAIVDKIRENFPESNPCELLKLI